MTSLYLDNLAYALGSVSREVGAAAAAGALRTPASALEEAGFASHHVCADDESAYDLARAAFARSGIDPSAIDCIVYSTCLPQNGNDGDTQDFAQSRDVKDLMRFPASRLQAEFAMHKAFVIGLNQQACTGALGGIRVARNMLLAEPELERIACVTADRFPPGALYEQAYNLISDGAAVCEVSRRQRGYRILDAYQITNGAMAAADDDQTVGCYFNYIHRAIFEILSRNRMDMDDIRWIVPQNTNRKAWQILARLLQVPEDRARFGSMARCGHVISADNLINLAELEASGQLSGGDKLLLFMAGFGSNWQCLLLERIAS